MYRELPYALDGSVVWTRSARLEPALARIVPDGCIDLIWSGGSFFVAGPDTAARLVSTPAGVDYVAVRFAPGHAPAVLGVPADELRDAQVPLDQLWAPSTARRLADQIAAGPDPPAVLASCVRAWQADAEPDPVILEVARWIRRGAAIEEAAAAVWLSPRHLRRRCLTAFGYGPKTLARVLRFDRALRLARSGLRLADVAATAGYADQAHLARDVRALAGTTLTDLLAGPD